MADYVCTEKKVYVNDCTDGIPRVLDRNPKRVWARIRHGGYGQTRIYVILGGEAAAAVKALEPASTEFPCAIALGDAQLNPTVNGVNFTDPSQFTIDAQHPWGGEVFAWAHGSDGDWVAVTEVSE